MILLITLAWFKQLSTYTEAYEAFCKDEFFNTLPRAVGCFSLRNFSNIYSEWKEYHLWSATEVTSHGLYAVSRRDHHHWAAVMHYVIWDTDGTLNEHYALVHMVPLGAYYILGKWWHPECDWYSGIPIIFMGIHGVLRFMWHIRVHIVLDGT